jgi:hypothetical protein
MAVPGGGDGPLFPSHRGVVHEPLDEPTSGCRCLADGACGSAAAMTANDPLQKSEPAAAPFSVSVFLVTEG